MNNFAHGNASPGLNDSSSIYDSALDNLTAFSSFNESANNNTSKNLSTGSTDFDLTLNISVLNDAAADANMHLIESESNSVSDNLEVDPKSQLAQKTIFKTNNPNLSIIEISDSPTKDDANTVYLIESSDDDDGGDNNDTEKRRRKVESLLHSSKQKLNSTSNEKINDTSSATSPAATDNASTQNTLLNITTSNLNDSSEEKNPPLSTSSPRSTPRVIQIYDTIEEFENNLPETVTVLTTPFGSKVYLVGTAHFSEESQDDVSFVIRNVRPDIVMVELCPSRIHILKLDEKTLLEEAKNFNLSKIRSIINTNGVINGVFFILLLHMSAQIAKELGMAPGGEFRRAFEEIHRIPGCMLHLGDRPINITLQRALRALSFWQTVKLVWRLASTESISIEEVEECKKSDLLEKLMQEMAGEFPAFSDVFVKERDMYLCHSLQVAALPQTHQNGALQPMRVVGVVGIGHASGIAKNWGKVDPNRIPEILEIPPASTSTRICKYTIKYGIIGLTLFGAFKFFRPKLGRII